MTDSSGLKGWTLITGASDGIGREFVLLAAAEGRDLILAARNGPRMESLAEKLRARYKIAVEVIPTDLSDPEAVELLWRRSATRRRIDVLVNNAGFGWTGEFADEGFRDDGAMINLNVMAPTLLMKRAIPHMRAAGGGRILNVASVAGFLPGPYMALYHATKSFLLTLSESVAEELRGSDVTVTVLCPGPTTSSFQKRAGLSTAAVVDSHRMASAASVARKGWRAMKRGRRVKVTGLMNWLTSQLPRFLPRVILARSLAKYLRER